MATQYSKVSILSPRSVFISPKGGGLTGHVPGVCHHLLKLLLPGPSWELIRPFCLLCPVLALLPDPSSSHGPSGAVGSWDSDRPVVRWRWWGPGEGDFQALGPIWFTMFPIIKLVPGSIFISPFVFTLRECRVGSGSRFQYSAHNIIITPSKLNWFLTLSTTESIIVYLVIPLLCNFS